MNQFKWTLEKTLKLREMYGQATWEELKQEFPISRHALQEYARKRGLKRLVSGQRKGDLTPLLNDSLETYYWIGFILADGCILNNGQLVVQLSIKDKEHLEKLARYLKTEIRKVKQKTEYLNHPEWNRPDHAYRIAVSDPKITSLIKSRFDIKQKKTYNPPDLNRLTLTHEQKLAILVGFIDGDGSINCKNIKIENHRSWYEFHKYFLFISDDMWIKINKRLYSELHINRKGYDILIKFINYNKLPALTRKWYK